MFNLWFKKRGEMIALDNQPVELEVIEKMLKNYLTDTHRYPPHQVCSVYTFGVRNYKLTIIHIPPNFVLSGRRRALLSFSLISVYRSEIEERAAKL